MNSFEYSVPSTVTVSAPVVFVGKPSTAGDPDSVLIKSPSTNTATIYIGGTDVSSANGYPLAPGDPAIGLDANTTEAVYAVCATGSQKLRVLKKYKGQSAP